MDERRSSAAVFQVKKSVAKKAVIQKVAKRAAVAKPPVKELLAKERTKKERPMWFDLEASDRWTDAIVHLRKDKKLAKVIDRVGPCTLRPRRDYFVKLVQSILSQQVSVAAAASMYRKLAGQFEGNRRPAG